MSTPAPVYVAVCPANHLQVDGSCTQAVWMPYPEPVLPPLSISEGWLVAGAICSLWAIAFAARLVFKPARPYGA